MPDNQNLFTALRAAFPADWDTVAVETDAGLRYRWRDLDRASAMIANLLQSLDIPPDPAGAPPRVAVQVEKSVEALLLYLGALRAGFVFLPLNTAYHSAEIAYFIGNAQPAVVVCTSANFPWVSPLAFQAGTRHVFTLNDDRTGSLLERAAHCSDVQQPAPRSDEDLAARAVDEEPPAGVFNQPPFVDEVPPSSRRATGARGVDRVSVRAVGRRVRIVGDGRDVEVVGQHGPAAERIRMGRCR